VVATSPSSPARDHGGDGQVAGDVERGAAHVEQAVYAEHQADRDRIDPTMARMIATTGSEPAGTPAVPMPARMHMSSTVTCCQIAELDAEELGQEQDGDAFEDRGSVLVRRSRRS
jgi:hypothetical protein